MSVDSDVAVPWDVEGLFDAPQTFPAEGIAADGVQAVFYEGPPWQGRPTRVFAWVGLPASAAGPAEAVPGMVLVHGGGGTAFAEWVRMWNRRGYAAIAMSTCGTVGVDEATDGRRRRHELAGPEGWGGFDQLDWPVEDQWTYHAVADVVLAHSLLGSMPGVDAGRIGLTGISWGGWLACIVAAVDGRFRFAVPVYGCGYVAEDSKWDAVFEQMGPDPTARWVSLWDPSIYLPRSKMPIFWVTRPNDSAYRMGPLQRSYRSAGSPRRLCVRVGMEHGHHAGWAPREIGAYADSMLRGGVPLATVTGHGLAGRRAWAKFQSQARVVGGTLNFTTGRVSWPERRWQTIEARLDAAAGRVDADVPDDAAACFLNVEDDRGLIASADHCELPPGG